ncbi:MAG TPA: hypothetical protein VEQ62_19660 [Stellaceae bacterium]|jgi:hypothetical protein|nr:hypothetical protein [Stellaceae bacterium]
MDDLKLPSDVLADRTTSERRFFDQGPAQEVIDFVVGNALRRAHPQFIEHSRHRRRPGGALDRQPLGRDVADFAGKQQLAIGKGQADGLMVEINARLATESATDFLESGFAVSHVAAPLRLLMTAVGRNDIKGQPSPRAL